MTVRRARDTDAPGIAAVHVGSWQAAYRGLIPQDFLDSLDAGRRAQTWRRVVAAPQWPRQGVFVCEGSGEDEADPARAPGLVGFAHICPVRDADLDPAVTGEVSSIYLLPGAWGRGHGRALMTAALATLAEAGFTGAALWVLDSNSRARAFYEAGGWRLDGGTRDEPLSGFILNELRYRHPLR